MKRVDILYIKISQLRLFLCFNTDNYMTTTALITKLKLVFVLVQQLITTCNLLTAYESESMKEKVCLHCGPEIDRAYQQELPRSTVHAFQSIENNGPQTARTSIVAKLASKRHQRL